LEIGKEFRLASSRLIEASRAAPGSRLIGDGARAHWALLRTLEALPCPSDFYEANAGRYWGLQTIDSLQLTCAAFRRAARSEYPAATKALEEAAASLDNAATLLADPGNPLWMALAEICVEGSDGRGELRVWFTSRGRRALFLDALQSRFDVSEADLATVGVAVRTVQKHLPTADGSEKVRRGVLASIPQTSDWGRIRALLDLPSLDVIAYSASLSRLRRQVDRCAQAWDVGALVKLLEDAGAPHLTPDTAAPRIAMGQPAPVGNGTLLEAVALELPTEDDLDADAELRRLFGGSQRAESDAMAPALLDQEAVDAPTVTSSTLVTFDEGWRAQYAPEQVVMRVIRAGLSARVQEVPARQLLVGDEVVAIHGQQRQSLYELLIARLHRNPAIELHLALLERWQQDVEAGYGRWVTGGSNLEELLGRLQAEGTAIISTSGIRQWVTGGTLAPQDPDDVRRLADVLELEFVRSNHQRISVAASRLRGLHRGLAHRLNRWLEGEAARGDSGEDEVIDVSAEIRFSDFRASLLHLHVSTVSVVEGLFLRSSLGLVERGEEHG
jgi:hypothetical protein